MTTLTREVFEYLLVKMVHGIGYKIYSKIIFVINIKIIILCAHPIRFFILTHLILLALLPT